MYKSVVLWWKKEEKKAMHMIYVSECFENLLKGGARDTSIRPVQALRQAENVSKIVSGRRVQSWVILILFQEDRLDFRWLTVQLRYCRGLCDKEVSTRNIFISSFSMSS